MSPVNWVWVLAALMGIVFQAVMGAAAKGKQESGSDEEWKVPALGLVVEWAGKIFVIANSEEQWVFPLPQGFLFYDGEDEAIWAPNLKQLVIRYLKASIADLEHTLRKFVGELEREKKLGNTVGVSYWEQQVKQVTETLSQYSKILDAVLNGQAKVRLVGFDDLQKIEASHEVEAI